MKTKAGIAKTQFPLLFNNQCAVNLEPLSVTTAQALNAGDVPIT